MAIGIGTGIYTPLEASRLTGLSVRRVKGWISGYRPANDTGHAPRPLVIRDPADGQTLSFLDLIEILFVNQFLTSGVKMSHIREASKKAMELFGRDHPFAVRRFETDGKAIFGILGDRGSRKKRVLGLVDGQVSFEKIVAPFFKHIDFRDSGDATRWWPMGRRVPVLLDPEISFGAPVTKTAHVPVFAINAALGAGESPARVAKWYDIPLRDVKAAEAFERHTTAA